MNIQIMDQWGTIFRYGISAFGKHPFNIPVGGIIAYGYSCLTPLVGRNWHSLWRFSSWNMVYPGLRILAFTHLITRLRYIMDLHWFIIRIDLVFYFYSLGTDIKLPFKKLRVWHTVYKDRHSLYVKIIRYPLLINPMNQKKKFKSGQILSTYVGGQCHFL